jgi:hypothetical protein
MKLKELIMLKIYKLIGEEPIVAEFLKIEGKNTFVKNPMIPTMRNIAAPDGSTYIGLGWKTVVQFVEDLEGIMKYVKLPTEMIMWQGKPTGEVGDSYRAAISQIEGLIKSADNTGVNGIEVNNVTYN